MYKMVKLLYKYNFDASSENEIERLYKYAKKLKDSKKQRTKRILLFWNICYNYYRKLFF